MLANEGHPGSLGRAHTKLIMKPPQLDQFSMMPRVVANLSDDHKSFHFVELEHDNLRNENEDFFAQQKMSQIEMLTAHATFRTTREPHIPVTK